MIKTKTEIIQETYDYYMEDLSRRGVGDDWETCVYKNEKGLVCAVGRCFNESARFDFIGSIISYSVKFPEWDSHFKPEYQGHDVKFWNDLQRLHDGDIISFNRAEKFNQLKNRYAGQ